MKAAPIVVKELRQLVRDPRAMLMLTLMPMFVMVLFGLGYGGERTGGIPIALVNMDGEPLSWQFLDTLTQNELLKVTYVSTVEKALELVRRGEVFGIVVVPEGFSRGIATGQTVYVRVIIDQSNAFLASSIGDVVVASLYHFQAEILREYGIPTVEINWETVYGPTVTRMESFMAMTMSVLLHLVPLQLVSLSICREKEKGTFERLIMAPISRWDIIAGKLVAYFLATVLDAVLTLWVAVTFFDVQIKGPMLDVFLFSSLFLVCSLCLGMLFSVISKSQLQATILSIFWFIPCMMYTGIFTPVEMISPSMRFIPYILPMYYYIKGFRKIVIRGFVLLEVASEALTLCFMAFVYFIVAVLLLRMQLE